MFIEDQKLVWRQFPCLAPLPLLSVGIWIRNCGAWMSLGFYMTGTEQLSLSSLWSRGPCHVYRLCRERFSHGLHGCNWCGGLIPHVACALDQLAPLPPRSTWCGSRIWELTAPQVWEQFSHVWLFAVLCIILLHDQSSNPVLFKLSSFQVVSFFPKTFTYCFPQ